MASAPSSPTSAGPLILGGITRQERRDLVGPTPPEKPLSTEEMVKRTSEVAAEALKTATQANAEIQDIHTEMEVGAEQNADVLNNADQNVLRAKVQIKEFKAIKDKCCCLSVMFFILIASVSITLMIYFNQRPFL